MADKVKVINLTDSGVSINLTALNNKVIPVAPKGFAILSIDELAYVRNTSTAFERGTLKLDDKSEAPADIDIPVSKNAISDDEISAILKKGVKQVTYDIAEIDNANVIRKILRMAKDQDKSVKVVEAIDARLSELV